MATNTLEIIIKASTGQAERSLKSLDKTVDKLGKTTGSRFDTIRTKFAEMDKRLRTPEGMKALVGVAGAVVGALTSVGMAAKKMADDFTDYAFQVKDFGRIIGATPEEASKLIQVADDVRLSVESLTTAMRSAITKGYSPTIAGLGKLSDEYLAIQDPIERSRFLIERFGRSGLEMAKLMELGSKSIIEMGDSIEGTGLLMTEKGIKAAEEYYAAMDALGDSAKGAAIVLGGELVPVIKEISNALNNVATDVATGSNPFVDLIADLDSAMKDGRINRIEYLRFLGDYFTKGKLTTEITAELTKKLIEQDRYLQPGKFENLTSSVVEYGKAQQGAIEPTTQMIEAQRIAAVYSRKMAWELMGISDKSKDAAGSIGALDGALSGLPEDISVSFDLKIPDITSQISNLLKNKKWLEAGGGAVEQFFIDIKPRLTKLTPAELAEVGKNVAAIELAAKVEIGEISPSEAARQLKESFGGTYGEALLTVKAAIEADPNSPDAIMEFLNGQIENNPLVVTPQINQTKYAEIFGAGPYGLTKEAEPIVSPKLDDAMYNAVVSKLTTPLVIPVTVRYTATGEPTATGGIGKIETQLGRDLNGNGVIGRATGGMVTPGQWYMVGERGPELFQPKQSGSIVPNDRIGGTVTITNNFSVVAATALDIRELARQVSREQQRAGAK